MVLTITIYEDGLEKETLSNPEWLDFYEINKDTIWGLNSRNKKEWKLEWNKTIVFINTRKQTVNWYISISKKGAKNGL